MRRARLLGPEPLLVRVLNYMFQGALVCRPQRVQGRGAHGHRCGADHRRPHTERAVVPVLHRGAPSRWWSLRVVGLGVLVGVTMRWPPAATDRRCYLRDLTLERVHGWVGIRYGSGKVVNAERFQ